MKHVRNGSETVDGLLKKRKAVVHRVPAGFWDEVAQIMKEVYDETNLLHGGHVKKRAQQHITDFQDWGELWDQELTRFCKSNPSLTYLYPPHYATSGLFHMTGSEAQDEMFNVCFS